MEHESSEELMFKVSLIEKHLQELSEKAEYVSQQIIELEEFNKGLSFMGSSPEKELLASMGRGVYIKSSSNEKTLLVNVGAGVMLKKTPEETKKIIESQIKNFYEARTNLLSQIEVYRSLMNQTVSIIQNSKKN